VLAVKFVPEDAIELVVFVTEFAVAVAWPAVALALAEGVAASVDFVAGVRAGLEVVAAGAGAAAICVDAMVVGEALVGEGAGGAAGFALTGAGAVEGFARAGNCTVGA
jgi:hypothetical protein